jgi:hypothetical protein
MWITFYRLTAINNEETIHHINSTRATGGINLLRANGKEIHLT